jgi:hypothetical protein
MIPLAQKMPPKKRMNPEMRRSYMKTPALMRLIAIKETM